MRRPEDCSNLQDIREAIDHIDRQIVAAIAERARYVEAASAFKTSESSVRAPERLTTMLSQRRQWAQDSGLNPDVIERLFRDMVAYFVETELEHWRRRASTDGDVR